MLGYLGAWLLQEADSSSMLSGLKSLGGWKVILAGTFSFAWHLSS